MTSKANAVSLGVQFDGSIRWSATGEHSYVALEYIQDYDAIRMPNKLFSWRDMDTGLIQYIDANLIWWSIAHRQLVCTVYYVPCAQTVVYP